MFQPGKIYAVFIFIVTVLLSGCSPTGPLRIAAYPSTPAPQPMRPMGRDDSHAGFSTDLALVVYDVDRAAREAADLSRSYGGYSDWQTCSGWGGKRIICMQLVVPAENKDYLLSALCRLGNPVESPEWWPEPDDPCQYCRAEAVIRLELRQQTRIDLPDSPLPGWDPSRTLRRAWAVAGTIFAFGVDALIWVVVVLGPFVLIGLGLWKLLQHFRRS